MSIRLITTSIRKCGYRKRGVYVVGGDSQDSSGVLARFTLINPPVPYQVKLHRGPRIVDGNAVLNRQPMNEWWEGSSKDTEQKKSGDQWALETFGMTVSKRLSVGECAGAADPDEALAILVSKIKWGNQIAHWFREMTRNKIQEVPRIVAEYSVLHEHLLKYTDNKQVGHLMQAQASLWRIAYSLPPTKRHLYIPFLMRILIVMGLAKDAGAMQKTFIGVRT